MRIDKNCIDEMSRVEMRMYEKGLEEMRSDKKRSDQIRDQKRYKD
jgi:hypothetical protein